MSKIGARNPHPKVQSQLSQERVKLQIWPLHYRVHPNKSPLKILEKRERGRFQGLTKIFKYELQILYAHSQDPSKHKSIEISGKVAVSVLRDSRKFSVHWHRARCTVIFTVAQLSCYYRNQDTVLSQQSRTDFPSSVNGSAPVYLSSYFTRATWLTPVGLLQPSCSTDVQPLHRRQTVHIRT